MLAHHTSRDDPGRDDLPRDAPAHEDAGRHDSTDPRVLRTRARVLAAARTLLLDEGLDAVTHLRVAQRSGAGRRTLYRHWPERNDLLRDVLSATQYPDAPPTGDLRRDLVEHLEALRAALVEGPLGFIVLVLNERAAVQPDLRPLRDQLTAEGCAPLHRLLDQAVKRGDLPEGIDVAAAAAALEGPVFYRAVIRAEDLRPAAIPPVVDAFLRAAAATAPPRS